MNDIASRRLLHQQVTRPTEGRVAEVVRRFGAMQAQDYRNALWAIGARTLGATETSIERAVAEGEIVRTWPMRGTLHFVAAGDAHWMLELLTPRILAGATSRAVQLGIDPQTMSRCQEICGEMLTGGAPVTREVLLAGLEQRGISTASQRGYHVLWRLAQQRLICFGPRQGNSPTFVLLDDWVPPKKRLTPSNPLAELARRYFRSHEPATLHDFVWWSGLKVSDARTAISEAELQSKMIDGVNYWTSDESNDAGDPLPAAHLLPAFDEYLLGYRDRGAVLDPVHAGKIVPGSNGVFLPIIVVNGQVLGTWKRSVRARSLAITAATFKRASRSVQQAVSAAAERYSRFVGLPVELSFEAK